MANSLAENRWQLGYRLKKSGPLLQYDWIYSGISISISGKCASVWYVDYDLIDNGNWSGEGDFFERGIRELENASSVDSWLYLCG